MNCPACNSKMEEQYDTTKHISGTYWVATKHYLKCTACTAIVLLPL